MTWKNARKVAGIFARQLVTIVVDNTVMKHLRLRTLEGTYELVAKDSNPDMLCMGTAKVDPWLQHSKDVISKYDLEAVTPDGWLYFVPKPTAEHIEACCTDDFLEDTFKITGLNDKVYLGNKGDYICRDPYHHDHQWIVAKALFETSYKIIET